MPTLANVQGGSLAPNLSGPLQIFTLLANQSRQKRAEEEAEAEALQALRTAGGLTASAESQGGLGGLLGPSPAQPGLTPDGDRAGLDGAVREALGQRAPPPANTKSTNVLGQVNPAVARQAAEVAARGSEVESAQFRNEATKGMALAKEMQKLPNFSAQRRRLGEMAADAIKEGTPEAQQRILQLMNMDEGQLALELTKMQVTGSGILAAVPEIKPTGPFRLFDTPEQRDGLARLMVINPQAAQVLVANRRDNIAQDRADAEAARIAAGPQSEFAQFAADIRTDVERGIIQPDVGERMIENARLKGTKELRAASAAAAKARAAAARPATDLGQSLAEIQRDEERGAITPDQAQTLRASAISEAGGGTPEFSGEVPKGFMLADPRNPRLGVIPIPGVPAAGGDLTTASQTAEQKIQRVIQSQGVDRTTAQGIVDGVLRVTRDPDTGDALITNLATGESFQPNISNLDQAAAPTAQPPAVPAPAPATPESVISSDPSQIGDITASLGGQGLVVNALNTVADAFSLPLPGPETDKAVVTLTSLNTRSMLGMAAEFPGRPSNLTRERIERLLVDPASFAQGPGRALSKFRSMRGVIQDSVEKATRVVTNTGGRGGQRFSKDQVVQASEALLMLQPLLEEYTTIIDQMEGGGAGQAAGETSSGVQWSIKP